MRNQFINILLNTFVVVFALCTVIYTLYILIYVSSVFKENTTGKPISYPEEIQAVRAGDTLYVSSVSDSIYIGFKKK